MYIVVAYFLTNSQNRLEHCTTSTVDQPNFKQAVLTYLRYILSWQQHCAAAGLILIFNTITESHQDSHSALKKFRGVVPFGDQMPDECHDRNGNSVKCRSLQLLKKMQFLHSSGSSRSTGRVAAKLTRPS